MSLSAEPSPQLNPFNRFLSLPPSSPSLPPAQFPRSSGSPSKRPSTAESDIDVREHKYPKIDYPRRTRLISHSIVSHLTELPTQTERSQAALLVAKSIDKSFSLDPDYTMVNIHQDPPSSQSELFDHANPDSWEIERLRFHGIQNSLAVGLRCFLDAFYYHCGFRPSWHPFIKETQQFLPNPRFKKKEQCVYESMKRLHSEYGIDRDAIVYLIGDLSYYNNNQTAIHNMALPAVGAAISNFYRRSKHGRQRAYRLVWKLLTGYDNFDQGNNDKRMIGSDGVTESRGPEDDEEDQVAYNEKVVFGSIKI
jgi:hypothetical protein